jgi:hypothetical protein
MTDLWSPSRAEAKHNQNYNFTLPNSLMACTGQNYLYLHRLFEVILKRKQTLKEYNCPFPSIRYCDLNKEAEHELRPRSHIDLRLLLQ